VDRAGRARVLALCWTGFILVFFTFSTTQEYYSMPCYPALALLLGCAMAEENSWVKAGSRVLGVIAVLAAVACFAIAYQVRNLPTPGDISNALALHPSAYTLSLGHMLDLTFDSFAYLRLALLVAGAAFLIGAAGNLWGHGLRNFLLSAIMMVIFFHAARLALVVFDPFLSSRSLAEAIEKAPPGRLIVNRHYYTYSSVFFYLNRNAPLLNGRRLNLEYGSFAPKAPDIFLTNEQFRDRWLACDRYYLVADAKTIPAFETLVGPEHLEVYTRSGGKVVLTNETDGAATCKNTP